VAFAAGGCRAIEFRPQPSPAPTSCREFLADGRHFPFGASMFLQFGFNPSQCSPPPCNCDQVVYVQIVRWVDKDSGLFFVPATYPSGRMVIGNADDRLDGWMVDRVKGPKWGYYGRLDDMSFDPGFAEPGDDTIPAALLDVPTVEKGNMLFEAVSVPVCIGPDGSACFEKTLGYHYWSFKVDQYGNNPGLEQRAALPLDRDAFDAAVREWNNQAASLGSSNLPVFGRVP
jgi:hypothetical protein